MPLLPGSTGVAMDQWVVAAGRNLETKEPPRMATDGGPAGGLGHGEGGGWLAVHPVNA